jgi:DNA-binding transcriptional regulator GbsR (MarR family)
MKMSSEGEKELREARGIVIDAIAETMDHYGINPSIGLLYGIMYFHNEPITLDEMGSEMGMSKGSMSTGVRKLIENKMVHRVYKAGERKDLFIAEYDFFKNFISFFCKNWEQEYKVNMDAIEKAEKKYSLLLNNESISDEVREEIKMDLQKMEESKQYYYFLERLIKCCESGEIFDLLQPK